MLIVGGTTSASTYFTIATCYPCPKKGIKEDRPRAISDAASRWPRRGSKWGGCVTPNQTQWPYNIKVPWLRSSLGGLSIRQGRQGFLLLRNILIHSLYCTWSLPLHTISRDFQNEDSLWLWSTLRNQGLRLGTYSYRKACLTRTENAKTKKHYSMTMPQLGLCGQYPNCFIAYPHCPRAVLGICGSLNPDSTSHSAHCNNG